MMKRNAFNLFEIIIVILLMSIFFSLSIPKFNSIKNENTTEITFENFKEFLLSLPRNTPIYCTYENCFLWNDEEEKKDKIEVFKNINGNILEVRAFYNDFSVIKPFDKKFGANVSERVILKFLINEYNYHYEFLLVTENGVYLYSNLYSKPLYFSNIEVFKEYMYNSVKKVQDVL